jgi:glycosyltransferase involved in cell wall biosynthesis
MNIAFLTTEYITESEFDGGLANYLYRVTQTLISRGHHVEIFTLSDIDNKIYHQGVIVHQVRNKSDFFDFLSRLTRYKFKRTFRFLSLSYCLRKCFLKSNSIYQFDIIQASSCFACGLFLTFCLDVPIVTRVSSLEYLWERIYRRPLTLDQRICEWLELFAIRRSNAAYSPSKFLANMLQKQKRVTTNVLRPPFLVEIDHFDESIYKKYLSGRKYFLFFGAIGFLKGCEIIARSLPGLLSKYPEIYFVFVGKVLEGPQGLTMLEFIMQQAGIHKDRIIYLGVLSHVQLYPVIKESRAVVLPSLIDNFPNTMLESMALGKVVIGTKDTSFEELIDNGVSGVLVDVGNPEVLSEAMEEVWNMTDEEREKIGHAAQKRVGLLSTKKTCGELEQYFHRVLSDRKTH